MKPSEILEAVKDNPEAIISLLNYGLIDKDDIDIKTADLQIKEFFIEREIKLYILVNDSNPGIRRKIAKRGFYLDILINDVNEFVRVEVAKHNFSLHKLINDEDWIVRQTVAEQGYRLDILKNDEKFAVAETAKNTLEKIKENIKLFKAFKNRGEK